MTIGLAIASWRSTERARLHVAADTRITRVDGSYRNDASVKTLDITDGIAAVFAGSVAPAFIAAEMVRGLLRSQVSTEPSSRFGFFDVARLLCHFTHLALPNIGDRSETILAGHLRSGAPALARVLVNEDSARITWLRCPKGGVIAIPVGPLDARHVLLTALARAKIEGTSLVHAGLGSIEYMARHPGDPFAGIGGQVSLGVCESAGEPFRWPAIIVGERTYWRGMDVTELWRPELSVPFLIPYDESWHAVADEEAISGPPPPKDGFRYYWDHDSRPPASPPTEDMQSAPPDHLFQVHPDPLPLAGTD